MAICAYMKLPSPSFFLTPVLPSTPAPSTSFQKSFGLLTRPVFQFGLPAMQETWVQSLGWGLLEKEMTTHSSILVWEIPGTEEPGRLQSMESQSDKTEQITFSLSLSSLKKEQVVIMSSKVSHITFVRD